MEYIATLRPIIEQAGHLALTIRAEGLETILKPDGTPVTNADTAVSEFITRELLAAFPHTKVVSEEHADLSGVDHPLTWIIDPIDGTKKYCTGKANWSVMVALFDTEPICSVVYFPEGPVWYWAERGKGAYCEWHGETHLLRMREPEDPVRIARSPGFLPAIGDVGSFGFMKHARKLLWHKLDAYVRDDIGYWDLIPPMLFVTEAGGVCLDLSGKPLVLTEPTAVQRGVFIAHPKAVPEVMRQLQQ